MAPPITPSSSPLLDRCRKHYVFWLEDMAPTWTARKVWEELEYPSLFQVSIATGLTSSLQVLEAIRRGYFPSFDLAILDVVLKDCKQRFIDIPRRREDTLDAPLSGKATVYQNLSLGEDLAGIDEFATAFGFDPRTVRGSERKHDGLFVWAWSVKKVCPRARYVIYSASEAVRESTAFLQESGVLEVKSKLELFKWQTLVDYRNDVAEETRKYEEVLHRRGAEESGKYQELVFRRGLTGKVEGPAYQLSLDALSSSAIDNALSQISSHAGAFIIHRVDVDPLRGARIEFDDVVEFAEWLKRERKSEIKLQFEKLAADRLRRCYDSSWERPLGTGARIESPGVDARIVKAVLARPERWRVTLQRRNGSEEVFDDVPFFLVPLRGRLGRNGNEISTIDEDLGDTYLLATFFLPWAGALMESDTRGQEAAAAISMRMMDEIEAAIAERAPLPFLHREDLALVVSVSAKHVDSFRVDGQNYSKTSESVHGAPQNALGPDAYRAGRWREDGAPDLEIIRGAGVELDTVVFGHKALHRELFDCEAWLAGRKSAAGGAGDLRLVIEGDASMLAVPFECLILGAERKQEHFLVKSIPLARRICGLAYQGGSLTNRLQRRLADRRISVLLIAADVKDESLGLDSLGEVERETETLAALIHNRFGERFNKVDVVKLSTVEASLERVQSALRSGYDIVHFAGHGRHDSKHPERSSLFVYRRRNRRGGVVGITAEQLASLAETARPALMYLSCCHGGAAGAANPRTSNFVGLAASIANAGVPTVVAFRWEIEDTAARRLAEGFYASLALWGEADVALRDARREGWERWERDDETFDHRDLLSPILISH